MQELNLYSVGMAGPGNQAIVWDNSTNIGKGLSTKGLSIPAAGTMERHDRQSKKNITEEKLPRERRRVTPPPSTFQRFSVDTNESLRFDPYVSQSDEDESQLLSSYRGQMQYSDEVFEEEDEAEETPIRDKVYSTPESDRGEHKMDREERLSEDNETEPDVFCTDCKTPTWSSQNLYGPHKDHRVILIPRATEEIKEDLQKTMSKLKEQILLMENFASHLEEIFITVEDMGTSLQENFGRQEQNLEQHYNDVIQALSQKYEQGASRLADEKKLKLEALYGQLVDCGKTLDISKELIETAQEIYRKENKVTFLQGNRAYGLSFNRIEDFSKDEPDFRLLASMEFENNTVDFSDIKQMMDSINILPAPSAPVINPQIPNSATSTSVHVCWSLFSDDTVEFYELHYRPVLDDATPANLQAPEVSKMRVKETYLTVMDLLPNAQYEFWVTATNTTGVSPASEKAVYMTVPSPPVIKWRECMSCPNAALIRWESGNTNPVDSYTMELNEIGAESNDDSITESIVAIPTCECLTQLQPDRQYSVGVRAVNIGGPSDRSKPVIIQTTGTYFHLMEETAHPCLLISEDRFTMFYGDEDIPLSDMIFSDNTFARCVAVLGDLIPVRGRHYWEVSVGEGTEFRVGVAYEDTQRNSFLGGNSTSWCMRHVITPSRHKYEFLHNGWSPDIRITVPPKRIGVMLDYDSEKLSFFNADVDQHLYTFQCHFLHLVHPCFALDSPGTITIHSGIAAPKCTIFD
ncbi:fibronectin type III and SPRY domain-containing protein 2 isoform X2 [Arapaima gigas]